MLYPDPLIYLRTLLFPTIRITYNFNLDSRMLECMNQLFILIFWKALIKNGAVIPLKHLLIIISTFHPVTILSKFVAKTARDFGVSLPVLALLFCHHGGRPGGCTVFT